MKRQKEVAITTTDNPFNPFDNFDEWYAFDEAQGYHTCSYLSRIAHTSEGLSDNENDDEIERAIDEIVSFNENGKYVKIYKN